MLDTDKSVVVGVTGVTGSEGVEVGLSSSSESSLHATVIKTDNAANNNKSFLIEWPPDKNTLDILTIYIEIV